MVLGWPAGWDRRTAAANCAMERLQRELAGFKVPPNRRGAFAAYAVGFSYGGGQQVAPFHSVCDRRLTICWQQPLPFKRTKQEAKAIQEFLDDPDVQAVLNYIGGESTFAFASPAPKLRSLSRRHFNLVSRTRPGLSLLPRAI